MTNNKKMSKLTLLLRSIIAGNKSKNLVDDVERLHTAAFSFLPFAQSAQCEHSSSSGEQP